MEFDTQSLMRILPFLRRYARALSGNQQTADTAVMATVQSLASIAIDDASPSIREHLYKCFTRHWNGVVGAHLRGLGEGMIIRQGAEQRLAAMPSLARQAFLLANVESFNDIQICRILDINNAKLEKLKDQARKSMIEQTSTTVMIIEDEMFIATELEDIMLDLGHEVVAIERTHDAARKSFARRKPRLLLADIQLADGSSGIDAANDILRDCAIPVIFITAYPERLLTGLRPEPAFVLPKPFRAETVKAIVTQALFFDTTARAPAIDVRDPIGVPPAFVGGQPG